MVVHTACEAEGRLGNSGNLCGLPEERRLLLALCNVVDSLGENISSGLASNLNLLLDVIVERKDYFCSSRTN